MNKRLKDRKTNKGKEKIREEIRVNILGEKPGSDKSPLDVLEDRCQEKASIKHEYIEATNAHIFKKAKVWSHLVSQQPGKCIDLDEESDHEEGKLSAAPVPNPEWDQDKDGECLGHGFGLGEDDWEITCKVGFHAKRVP